MAQEIGAARNAFEVPEDVIYLNCASLAPRLKRVTAAGHAAVDRMAAPWNIHAPDWFRDARALAGAFAAIDRSAGGMRDARALRELRYRGRCPQSASACGENIVVIDQEYPSNYYSWRRVADANGAEIRSVRPAGNAESHGRDRHRDRPPHAVVAVAQCRWTDGYLVGLAAHRGSGSAARRGAGR